MKITFTVYFPLVYFEIIFSVYKILSKLFVLFLTFHSNEKVTLKTIIIKTSLASKILA